MTQAIEIVTDLMARGIEIWPDGNTLRCRPRSRLDPQALDQLKTHKLEILRYLESQWPKPCREAAEQFGHASARLYPLIGRRVRTALGSGKLLQVLNNTAAVHLDGDSQVTYLHFSEVLPGG